MSGLVLVFRGRGSQVDMNAPPRYLKSYDPEFADGRGKIEWTDDRAEALVFADFGAAYETYGAVPRCHPLRDDGKPNRPLTAYSVEFAPA